jgi:hypothetical protein
MKVSLAFYPARFKIPQICSKCAQNPSFGYDEEKVIEYTDWSGKRWRTWTIRFPYCQSCLESLRKKKLFKGKAKSVEVSIVETKKVGGFLKKKKIPYVIFDFKNYEYGRLFEEANKDILLDKVVLQIK